MSLRFLCGIDSVAIGVLEWQRRWRQRHDTSSSWTRGFVGICWRSGSTNFRSSQSREQPRDLWFQRRGRKMNDTNQRAPKSEKRKKLSSGNKQDTHTHNHTHIELGLKHFTYFFFFNLSHTLSFSSLKVGNLYYFVHVVLWLVNQKHTYFSEQKMCCVLMLVYHPGLLELFLKIF